MTRLWFFIGSLVVFSSLVIPIIISQGHLKLPKKVHVALFIFGDSYFDAGNNNYINTTADYQANFQPYGESFFKYPTGRFSDGRLVSDFIAEYAKLPLISTFLQSSNDQLTSGVNFASAGAGTLVETHQGLVIDLKTQLSNFKIVEQQLKQKLGDAAAKKLISKAVYLFSIGSNDYFTLFSTNSSVLQSHNSKLEYVEMVIGNLTNTIKEIYEEGGRKFGFLNLLPLGCIPSMKVLIVPGSTSGNSCQEDGIELAKLHNKALSESLQELERVLEGFGYSYHDFYGSLIERMNNPEAYGFKEVTACCGTGTYRGIPSCGGKREIKEYEVCEKASEYLFFDADHPSEMASKQIAELMWSSATPNVTWPYNLKTLFHHIYTLISYQATEVGNQQTLTVMARTPSKFIFSIIILTLHSSIHCFENNITKTKLFVFGDSIVDTGNNQYLLADPKTDYAPGDWWPYGITFPGNPTGRVSDGRLVPDFIAEFANLSLPVPFLQPGAKFTDGVNFASAGSCVLDTNRTNLINLSTQLGYFKKFATEMEQKIGLEEAKNVLKRSVYLFNAGGNDYLNFNNNYTNPTVPKQIELVGRVMTNLMSTLEEIYAIGGRKFAFQNIGPLGCMPRTRQTNREFNVDCVERYTRHALLHNNFLSISLKEMEGELPGFKYTIFDFYNALRNRILNPRKYGFEEGKIACCGTGELNGEDCSGGPNRVKFDLCEDPDEYVFFDGVHHTQMTNLQLAQLLWNGTGDVTGPHYNVKELFELNLTPNLIITSAI
ncbi:hypothetical protein Dsin_014583 [Dipteronia sinensis]|uniref:Uncharacterized protein n=1 Tax=Dipteronia sinensis TaxID=43782 RepID=A0AAE0E9Y9_9ROSI|nr:hypothetical protein Dsin_014583 [Dipteronia sinensis]